MLIFEKEQQTKYKTLKIAYKFAVLSFTAMLNEDDIMRNKNGSDQISETSTL